MSDLKDLKKVIPYKWRIQSFSKTYPSATCVAYIDARDVMAMLDDIVGPENWQSDYKEIKGNLYCGVAIRIDNEWIWKWDCGTESNTEKEKGEASDAFKRAAVRWGIGRFLYDLEIQYIKTNAKKDGNNYSYPVNDRGEKIKDLSVYLNESNKISYISSKHGSAKSEKKIKKILEKIEACTTLDELRAIREENSQLETENPTYKKALARKYEILSENKSETTAIS